jgi:hypothetical protein
MSKDINLSLSQEDVALIITALLCVPNNVTSQILVMKIVKALSALDEG